MRTSISQVCTLNASFEKDIEGYADAGCRAVEVWFTKLEQYLESHSLDDCRRLLEGRDVELVAAAVQGGLFGPAGPQRDTAEAHFRARLDLCRRLAIPTVVVAADLYGELTGSDLEAAQEALSQVSRWAGDRGVRVALEFQKSAVFPNNLESALAWIAHVGEASLGICLDVFHFMTGPSKAGDLEQLSRTNLFHVQLSDLSGVPRELASDADRILPGDGDFPLGPILARLREIDYDGYVSLELMNPSIWQVAPEQVAEVGLTALRKSIGEAAM